ncbi:MAG: nucleotidyltransferase domain-containing protein [Candidatus Bathyarchaeia archaeon]
MTADSLSSRQKVAIEAANLLYYGVEKEYKQAKLKAAKTFGLHFMPTNLDVAMEIDRIAEENEGVARQERLVRMRKEAFRIMNILKRFDPLLVGSVWRGTIHHDSDLDIIVHYEEPEEVLKAVEQTGLKILRSEWVNVTKRGKKKGSFHIHAESPIKEQVEILVHSPDEACLKEKCEVYGDEIVGLRLRELGKVLEETPTRRFVPPER